jgi:hypothetical protein
MGEQAHDHLRRVALLRDDVLGRGPAAARVLGRHVAQPLFVGVGMHRGQKGPLDAEGLVQQFDHGGRTMGRARAVGDNPVGRL